MDTHGRSGLAAPAGAALRPEDGTARRADGRPRPAGAIRRVVPAGRRGAVAARGDGPGHRRRRRPALCPDGAAQVVGRRRLRLLHQLRRAQEPRAGRQSRGRPPLLLGAPRSPGAHRGVGDPRPPSRVRRLLRHPGGGQPHRRPRLPPEPAGRRPGRRSTPRWRRWTAEFAGRRRAPAPVVGRLAGHAPRPSSSGSRARTGSTTVSATRPTVPPGPIAPPPALNAAAGGRRGTAPAAGGKFSAWQMTRHWSRNGPPSSWRSSTRGGDRRGVPGPPVRPGTGLDLVPRGLRWTRACRPNLQRIVDRRLAEAGATPAGAREFFGLTMAGPDRGDPRLRRAAGPPAAPHVHRRGVVVPAVQRARVGLRPGRPGHPGGPRRRRVGHHRAEGVEHAGPHRRPGHAGRPHRPRRRPSTRGSPTSPWTCTRPGSRCGRSAR